MNSMNNACRINLVALASLIAGAQLAGAAVVQTIGAGSAVTTIDRSANFDSLVTGSPLFGYTEGQLSISTSGYAYEGYDPFNGAGNGSSFYYPSGGNSDWVTITTTDTRPIAALEFLYGNGWYANNGATVDWQAYNGATLLDSGSVSLAAGTIIGFKDPTGFESLLVRATLNGSAPFEAIAIDDLNVQLAAVPEPTTMFAGLGALSLVLMAFRGRSRR